MSSSQFDTWCEVEIRHAAMSHTIIWERVPFDRLPDGPERARNGAIPMPPIIHDAEVVS
jgi:hypothetical protein